MSEEIARLTWQDLYTLRPDIASFLYNSGIKAGKYTSRKYYRAKERKQAKRQLHAA